MNKVEKAKVAHINSEVARLDGEIEQFKTLIAHLEPGVEDYDGKKIHYEMEIAEREAARKDFTEEYDSIVSAPDHAEFDEAFNKLTSK